MPEEFTEPGRQLTGMEPYQMANAEKKKQQENFITKREQIVLTCVGAILSHPSTKLLASEAEVKKNVALAISYTNEIIRRFTT